MIKIYFYKVIYLVFRTLALVSLHLGVYFEDKHDKAQIIYNDKLLKEREKCQQLTK